MINFRQFECFKMVAEELNFTRAAEKLHMAQPPLSRQVRLLEETLGVLLIERTKRSVKLTPEGEYLKKEIDQTFRHLEAVKSNLRQMNEGRRGLLSVGYVGAAMHAVLPGLLRKFAGKYKEVSIHLHEMDNGQQLEALRKGSIDIGFLRSHLNDHALTLFSVYEEPFLLIAPKKIRLSGAKPGTLAALADLPFIAFPLNCAPDMVKSIYSILGKLKLEPTQVHESSQINSILRIVESGIGYAILPASVKNGYKPDVSSLDLSGYRERAVMYAAVNTSKKSSVVENFLEVMGVR